MLDLSPSNFDDCAENFHTQIKVSGNDPPAMTSVPAQGATVIGKKIDRIEGKQRHRHGEDAVRFDQLPGNL